MSFEILALSIYHIYLYLYIYLSYICHSVTYQEFDRHIEYIISDGSQRSRKLSEIKTCGSREGIKEEEILSVKTARESGKYNAKSENT